MNVLKELINEVVLLRRKEDIYTVSQTEWACVLKRMIYNTCALHTDASQKKKRKKKLTIIKNQLLLIISTFSFWLMSKK